MLMQEAILILLVALANVLSVPLILKDLPIRKIRWYEEGIGGYAVEGNRTTPVPGYPFIEVNPFDYPFGRMPNGTFNPKQPFAAMATWYGAIIGFVGLGWMMANAPNMFTISLFYFVFLLFASMIIIAENISATSMPATSAVVFGYGAFDGQVISGAVTGMAFIGLMQAFKVFGLQVETLQVEDMPIASFIIVAIIIPLVEESVFRNVVGMSAAEMFGWIPGLFVSALLFGIFHAYAYQLNLQMMFMAFLFGLFVQFWDYKYKSMLPGLIAHTIVNAWAFFSV